MSARNAAERKERELARALSAASETRKASDDAIAALALRGKYGMSSATSTKDSETSSLKPSTSSVSESSATTKSSPPDTTGESSSVSTSKAEAIPAPSPNGSRLARAEELRREAEIVELLRREREEVSEMLLRHTALLKSNPRRGRRKVPSPPDSDTEVDEEDEPVRDRRRRPRSNLLPQDREPEPEYEDDYGLSHRPAPRLIFQK